MTPTALAFRYCFLLLFLITSISTVSAVEQNFLEKNEELTEVIVRASRVANTRPAGTYTALATTLRFDPQTELQSRGLAEGQ